MYLGDFPQLRMASFPPLGLSAPLTALAFERRLQERERPLVAAHGHVLRMELKADDRQRPVLDRLDDAVRRARRHLEAVRHAREAVVVRRIDRRAPFTQILRDKRAGLRVDLVVKPLPFDVLPVDERPLHDLLVARVRAAEGDVDLLDAVADADDGKPPRRRLPHHIAFETVPLVRLALDGAEHDERVSPRDHLVHMIGVREIRQDDRQEAGHAHGVDHAAADDDLSVRGAGVDDQRDLRASARRSASAGGGQENGKSRQENVPHFACLSFRDGLRPSPVVDDVSSST